MHKGDRGGAGGLWENGVVRTELVVITVLDTPFFAVGQLQSVCNGVKQRQGWDAAVADTELAVRHRIGVTNPRLYLAGSKGRRVRSGLLTLHPTSSPLVKSRPARLDTPNPGHPVGLAYGDKVGRYRIGATRVGDRGRSCNAAGVRHWGMKMGFRGGGENEGRAALLGLGMSFKCWIAQHAGGTCTHGTTRMALVGAWGVELRV
jgi:hypothetical protein